MSIDLEKVDVSETGHWFCLGCHRISEPVDYGDVWIKCVHCKKERLEWRDPVRRRTTHQTERLMARKNFGLLAASGFWFCQGCGRITAVTGARRCILCSGGEVVYEEAKEGTEPRTSNAEGRKKKEPPTVIDAREQFKALRQAVGGEEPGEKKLTGANRENRETNNETKLTDEKSDDRNQNRAGCDAGDTRRRDGLTQPGGGPRDPNAGKLWRGGGV